MHISPYEKGNIFNTDPTRSRKLLLNRREINKLIGYIQQKGYALVPLQVYLKRGWVKVQLAVAKGKKLYDKRSDAAKRDAQRSIERAFKDYQNA
jgi:SsrA-binding protein